MQPEKLLIFIPIIIFFSIFAVLVIGFLALVISLVNKGRKSAWIGILTDKMFKTRDEYDSNKVNHFYTLVFKIGDGKEIKVGTSKEMFDSFNIGDRAEKKSGEFWPKKII
jgi:hypothetical protein